MLFKPRVMLVKIEVRHTGGVVKIGIQFADKRIGLVELVDFWLFFTHKIVMNRRRPVRWLWVHDFDARQLSGFDSVLFEIGVEVGFDAVVLEKVTAFERISLEDVVPERIASEGFALERIFEQVVVLEAMITGEPGR